MKLEEDIQIESNSIAEEQKINYANSDLSLDNLERVAAWGGASSVMSYVYRPSNVDGLQQVLNIARENQRSIGLRGAGNSYGDATLNSENITLDMRRMNRILNWNPTSGEIQVEPGVTIGQLWEYTLEDGWWPAVVPGTAKPTIGGCAGMNVHGKNAWKAGTIGDHINEFDMMLPSGEIITCNRESNAELFYAAIGGFGMLGIFTSITLRLKQVYSGLLDVEALVSRNLEEMIEQFDIYLQGSDYIVGWIDSFSKGKSLGRGQIHIANYLPPGADPYPQKTLQLDNQHLSDTMFGFVPRSIMWRFMRPFANDYGWHLINIGKYHASRLSNGSKFRQPHVAFHFLLDYIPNFKLAYGSGGLIQYQCFVPKQNALETFKEILQICQERGIVNYLSVLKRHRPDDFLISHGVDGFSLAMDFRVTQKRKQKIVSLAKELNTIVLQGGGRFYFAKDSLLQPENVSVYLGEDVINRFLNLKATNDPGSILQTNLWRRIFGSYT